MEQQVVVRRGGRGNNINKAYCESGLPQPPQRCPRCESMNTKFCYFNNYSLSQPRYFCKSCKRYWTQGGSLRNVPIGGGSRKGKRAKTTTSHDEVEVVPTPPPMDSSASPFYGVGGYLSSLQPAFHNSFNPSSSSLINSPNLELGGNREVEEGGLGGLILTTMNSHHHDWSQTFMPSNGNGIGGSSSSLIPNHDQLPHLPGFGPLP